MNSTPPNSSVLSPKVLIFLGMLFAYLSLGMVVPLMAPLVRELGLTEFQGGLIFAFNYFIWVLASPFWGRQSEVWGRKPFIILGLVGFSVGHFMFAFIAELGLDSVSTGTGVFSGTALLVLLIAARGFAGGLFSGAPPASQAYIVDMVSAKERTAAVALLGAAAGLGTVVGPVVPMFTSFFPRLTIPIYLAAALPLIPALLITFLLPSGSHTRLSPKEAPVLSYLDRRYTGVLSIGLMMNVAFALMLFTLGFYIEDRMALSREGTAAASSFAMVLVGLVGFLVQAIVLPAIKLSPVTLMRTGLMLMAAGMGLLLIPLWPSTMVYVALVVFGAGYSFTYPGFMSAVTFTVEESEQGSVAGLAAGTGAIAFIIGPIVGTLLYGYWWEAPYILSAIVLAITGVYAMLSPGMARLRLRSKEEESSEQNDSSSPS